MIIYRPIAPLNTGRAGLRSALAAMALTAALGTTWQACNEPPEIQESAAPAANAGTPSPRP